MLTWNAERVPLENRDGAKAVILESIVLATMEVGMNEITEKNHGEFFRRLAIAEMVKGTYLSNKGARRPITRAEVKGFIGLWTNASTFGYSVFKNNMMAYLERKVTML